VGVTTADPVAAMAEAVGPAPDDPVTCVGGRTQWSVGGELVAGTREVRPPTGIVTFEPEEMTVRVRAGTSVIDLDAALAPGGQTVALPAHEGASVGGVLSVGHSGLRRLGWGPIREALLEARFVSADGRVVKAGGPTVKNVSGFDLCRLLVGSLGTLGLLAEVVLRTRPRPEASAWLAGETDPFDLRARLHRPASILWDGTTTWVHLDGRAVDVRAETAVLVGLGFAEVGGPPPLPPHRTSLDPATLRSLGSTSADGFVAAVGVGTVHWVTPPPRPPVDEAVAVLNRRVKARFDPSGRLSPGRDPLLA
jgi:glycolate oxidase FAD binding subunit